MPMLAPFPRPRWRAALTTSLVTTLLMAGGVWAQAATPNAAGAPSTRPKVPENSNLDAPLFYQLLIGELELRGGEAGNAFEVLLDAARRTRDEELFRRAVDIALQARAGEQALVATQAWRSARPESLDALRYQVQLLTALNRLADVGEPLRTLLAQTTVVEQPGLIASMPRFFQRTTDRRAVAALFDEVLKDFAAAPGTRTASLVALGRVWFSAGDVPRALQFARDALAADPAASGPALLALEMLPGTADAERVVTDYLKNPKAEPAVRLAYVQVLTAAQRYADAVAQLEAATREQPSNAAPWLTLGALQLELNEPKRAEAALLRYVELRQASPASPAEPAEADDTTEGETPTPPDARPAADEGGLVQAWLLLAQAAEQRGDLKAAETWLAKVDSPQRALEVQARRAGMLARQGQVREARELIRRTPERQPEDARSKLLAESQVLRDVKQWNEARAVLASANDRFPNDPDLLYEQAMVDEKLNRVDDMERLLRKVIQIKPDHQHAYNALGYSLADRNTRLPEARQLIAKALEMAPGDPFITDSLGWAEYRLGNRAEALRLLRAAYAARPDVEIAAHLGEVLWSAGEHDEARRVWGAARSRDAGNEVLKETLARLKVDL
jgi:tetratricopeptide (TPR) repeat protein